MYNLTLLCVEFAVEDCLDHRGAGAMIGARDGMWSMKEIVISQAMSQFSIQPANQPDWGTIDSIVSERVGV